VSKHLSDGPLATWVSHATGKTLDRVMWPSHGHLPPIPSPAWWRRTCSTGLADADAVLVDRRHGGEQDQRAEHQAQHITWVAGVPTGPGPLMVVCMPVDPLATTAAGRPRAGHRP
jgi:hypothetical protein